MVDLPDPGLYEALITAGLDERLQPVDSRLTRRRALRTAEAPDRIAWHLQRQIETALSAVPEQQRLDVGLRVATALLGRLADLVETDPGQVPAEPLEVLHAVLRQRAGGEPDVVAEPLIPLLDSTLLTNSPGEPTLWSQVESEMDSAEAVDVVMAFIRRSGIVPLLGAVRRHTSRGRPFRVLTTTYTGSTEQAALELLRDAGADVRISYDLTGTRLHAKAWLFHRRSGFSTAYVGSSNLTHSAQVTGLEWNVRVSAARNRELLAKFEAVFDGYWSGGEFLSYDPDQFEAEQARAGRVDRGPQVVLSPVELRPLPYQDRLLELVAVARERGHRRNLVVAATGTGKTVVAAVDYARWRARHPRARLLFVAHREEILDQALATFRYALRDASFGEKWVGGARPERYEHVFASIQSLHANGLRALAPDHFDVVIVDEFHHAAARSYRQLLDHVAPEQLLGLTATPERSDGLPVLDWFDGRVAAELRLWDAIDQQHLTPFLYYGVHDQQDLRDIPWRRGVGYDASALSDLYTSSDAWARLVVHEVARHAQPDTMRCLGFCVSVQHARFMAEHFTRAGLRSVAVWADSPREERETALRDLAAGHLAAVFSVDLFNEGVDVPTVDTVLLLRPTESPTLFLQQLGRGLRKAHGKSHCTVLDFVGTHRREFRFDRRYRALLGGSRRDVERAVEQGFPFLPAGCHVQLDRKASEIVLRSIREALPSRWPAKVAELASLRRDRPDIDLAQFLEHSGLDLEDVYDGGRSWSDLQQDAGVEVLGSGPHERALRRAAGRLLHVDDRRRLAAYREHLDAPTPPAVGAMDDGARRLLHMLVAQVTDSVTTKAASLQEAVDLLWAHPQVLRELAALFGVLEERVAHLHHPLALRPQVPLQVHARYTRIEILAAMGHVAGAKIPSWQAGVFDVAPAGSDLLAFTLDKSSGGFSPTTRYRDYALSRSLIHWESQSVTRADSETGQRYIHHERLGRAVLLFARLRADDRAFWFLGPGTYQGHVGERPMAITWQLHHELPGDLYASFSAAA